MIRSTNLEPPMPLGHMNIAPGGAVGNSINSINSIHVGGLDPASINMTSIHAGLLQRSMGASNN